MVASAIKPVDWLAAKTMVGTDGTGRPSCCSKTLTKTSRLLSCCKSWVIQVLSIACVLHHHGLCVRLHGFFQLCLQQLKHDLHPGRFTQVGVGERPQFGGALGLVMPTDTQGWPSGTVQIANQADDLGGDDVHRWSVGTVRKNHIGVALGRLDKLLVHGAHRI